MEPTQNQQSTQNTPPAQPAPVSAAPKKSNTGLFVLLFVILLLIAGMLYFVIRKNPVNTQSVQQKSSQAEVTKSPEEKEVDSVDVSDPAPTELQQVQKDVQGL